MHREEIVDLQMARSSVYDLLSSLLCDRPAAETIRQLTSPQAVELIDVLFGDPEIGHKLHRLAGFYREADVNLVDRGGAVGSAGRGLLLVDEGQR